MHIEAIKQFNAKFKMQLTETDFELKPLIDINGRYNTKYWLLNRTLDESELEKIVKISKMDLHWSNETDVRIQMIEHSDYLWSANSQYSYLFELYKSVKDKYSSTQNVLLIKEIKPILEII